MAQSLDRTDIQNRVSRIYRYEIVPLLDKLLSNKSASSTLIIDRLEINIGRIPADRLEAALAEKISKALQESLDKIKTPPPATGKTATIVKATISHQESHSDAELIIYFLQTGLFPWWVQETTYAYMEKALQAFLHQKKNSTDFRDLFITLLQNNTAVKRLIFTFSDEVLEQIAGQLISNDIAAISPQKEQLFDVFTNHLSAQQLREYWWVSVYQTITATHIHSAKELFENAGSFFVHLAAQKSSHTNLLQFLQNDRTTGGILEKIAGFTNEAKNKLQKRAEEKTSRNTENKAFRSNDEAKASSLQSKQVEIESSSGSPAKAEKTDDERFSARAGKTHPPSLESENKKSSFINHPKSFLKLPPDVDKIYIQNAGLILLWPFLNRFFQNTGFADDKTFTNESNAEQACLMLQYLVTGSTEELLEAQLPLNKILCGIPLLQPVNTQWSIGDEEKAIAENFLLAVIQNGGAGWKNLSVDSLRQAYLNREGIISGRDGNWLLQVKRETYDVLIDRLPWTIQVVKLPWMERLVFVEWQPV